MPLSDSIFTQVWWRYDSQDSSLWSQVYHTFNLAEGVIWLILGVLVARRFHSFRRTRLEILYSVAFMTFAASDFREAWQQSSGLILLKLCNLIALFWLRRRIMRHSYPDASLY
jgi:hypothetical protein